MIRKYIRTRLRWRSQPYLDSSRYRLSKTVNAPQTWWFRLRQVAEVVIATNPDNHEVRISRPSFLSLSSPFAHDCYFQVPHHDDIVRQKQSNSWLHYLLHMARFIFIKVIDVYRQRRPFPTLTSQYSE